MGQVSKGHHPPSSRDRPSACRAWGRPDSRLAPGLDLRSCAGSLTLRPQESQGEPAGPTIESRSGHIYPDFSPQFLAPRECRFGCRGWANGKLPAPIPDSQRASVGAVMRRAESESQRSPPGARATLAWIGLVISGAQGVHGKLLAPLNRGGAVLGTSNPVGRAPLAAG